MISAEQVKELREMTGAGKSTGVIDSNFESWFCRKDENKE